MSTLPDIVYLHSHDTGRYIQPYGHAVDTPNLQRLAEEGVMFRQAFCAAPTCSPSRAGLLTGQWPHQSGMLGLAHRGWRLHDYRHHLVHTLKGAGYRTLLCGIQHVAAATETHEPWQVIGYDQAVPPGDGPHGTAAARFLRDNAPADPFFMDIGLFETHRRFPEPACDHPTTDPRYVKPPGFLPDTPQVRRDVAAYNTMARAMDRQYGEVLDALRDTGRLDNTIIVCTTDHGIAFPRAKCNLTDHGIGVLLILRGPERLGFTPGTVSDAMVSQIDVFPTLCELAGAAAPDRLEGASMMPLVRGEAESIREELFAEVSYHAAYEPQRCVRTARYKYIRRFDDRTRAVLPNCDDGPSKTVALEMGLLDEPRPADRLFDLACDPTESRNLADQPAHAAALADMRRRLDRWMHATDDPLLRGPIPLIAGGVANDPDQRSPNEPATS